jgi:glycerol uptake facilitator-like aquaporin
MINNKYLAEFIGTAILVLVITGSGIMGYDLSRGNLGIALLINSIATGIALFILISIFINISGAHFNPLVTLVSWAEGEINNEIFIKYFLSQLMGALLGIMIAHLIFYLPIVQFATKFRSGYPFWISEFISTLILLFVIKHFSNTNKNQINGFFVSNCRIFIHFINFFCKSCINNRKEFYRYFCWNLFRQHHWLCNFTITSYACLYIFC